MQSARFRRGVLPSSRGRPNAAATPDWLFDLDAVVDDVAVQQPVPPLRLRRSTALPSARRRSSVRISARSFGAQEAVFGPCTVAELREWFKIMPRTGAVAASGEPAISRAAFLQFGTTLLNILDSEFIADPAVAIKEELDRVPSAEAKICLTDFITITGNLLRQAVGDDELDDILGDKFEELKQAALAASRGMIVGRSRRVRAPPELAPSPSFTESEHDCNKPDSDEPVGGNEPNNGTSPRHRRYFRGGVAPSSSRAPGLSPSHSTADAEKKVWTGIRIRPSISPASPEPTTGAKPRQRRRSVATHLRKVKYLSKSSEAMPESGSKSDTPSMSPSTQLVAPKKEAAAAEVLSRPVKDEGEKAPVLPVVPRAQTGMRRRGRGPVKICGVASSSTMCSDASIIPPSASQPGNALRESQCPEDPVTFSDSCPSSLDLSAVASCCGTHLVSSPSLQPTLEDASLRCGQEDLAVHNGPEQRTAYPEEQPTIRVHCPIVKEVPAIPGVEEEGHSIVIPALPPPGPLVLQSYREFPSDPFGELHPSMLVNWRPWTRQGPPRGLLSRLNVKLSWGEYIRRRKLLLGASMGTNDS
eukprot:RCo042159